MTRKSPYKRWRNATIRHTPPRFGKQTRSCKCNVLASGRLSCTCAELLQWLARHDHIVYRSAALHRIVSSHGATFINSPTIGDAADNFESAARDVRYTPHTRDCGGMHPTTPMTFAPMPTTPLTTEMSPGGPSSGPSFQQPLESDVILFSRLVMEAVKNHVGPGGVYPPVLYDITKKVLKAGTEYFST